MGPGGLAPSLGLPLLTMREAELDGPQARQPRPRLSGHVPLPATERWTRHVAEKLQNCVPKISERLADGDVVCGRGRRTNWK